jgi:hypothetical protein
MKMASLKISAKSIISQAREFFSYDWQGACAYLQGVLGCSFAEVLPLFQSETLVDGAEPGTLVSVPDPDINSFLDDARSSYRSRINVSGAYFRPCAEVLTIGPMWMAKQADITLPYPDWDEDPVAFSYETQDGPRHRGIKGTSYSDWVEEHERIFTIGNRHIVFEPCEPPPPWMVCESPEAALAAWEEAKEWLWKRGWEEEIGSELKRGTPCPTCGVLLSLADPMMVVCPGCGYMDPNF